MEQFLLFPASVYNNNKSLNTKAVTKQELPMFQAGQNPTYQNDSLRKETLKMMFAQADSLFDKILSCPRIKLSNSQTSILDAVETGVLLSDFVRKLRCQNAYVPGIYITLVDSAGISPNSSSDSKCQSPRERKLGRF